MRQPLHQHLDPLDPPDRLPTAPALPGKYLSLTSFRRDGTGVATPVWFVEARGRLLVETDAASYKVRRGRRITWIEEALAPLRGQLPNHQLRRLVHAIGATVGIEALVWLTDIAGLSRQQAVEVMRWSAETLLRAALTDADADAAQR